jgi:hypothetical protein
MGIALDQQEAAGRKPPGLGSGIAALLAATAATFFYSAVCRARFPQSLSRTLNSASALPTRSRKADQPPPAPLDLLTSRGA